MSPGSWFGTDVFIPAWLAVQIVAANKLIIVLLRKQVVQDALRDQAGGDQGGGQASAGVGAGADEVEVVVAGVPVVGAEAELVAYLTPARDALRQSAGK